MGHYRFLIPVFPVAILLTLAGVAAVAGKASRRAVLFPVAAAALLAPAWLRSPAWERGALGYAAGLANAQVPFGLRVRSECSPATILAMDDAGAGPFYADRTNIDMLGLNDAHIGHLRGGFYQKYDERYVLARRPDLVVLLSFVAEPARDADFRVPGHAALFRDAGFRKGYRFARRYRFDPTYYLQVWRRIDSATVPESF